MASTVKKLRHSHGNSQTMQNMVKRLRELKAKYKSEKRPPKPRPLPNPDKHGVNDTLVPADSPKPLDLTVLKRPDSAKPPAPISQISQPSQASQAAQAAQGAPISPISPNSQPSQSIQGAQGAQFSQISQISPISQPSQAAQASQGAPISPVAQAEVPPKLPIELGNAGNVGNAGMAKPAARVSVRPPTPLPPGGIHRVGFQRPVRRNEGKGVRDRKIGDFGRDDTQWREESGESGVDHDDVSAGY